MFHKQNSSQAANQRHKPAPRLNNQRDASSLDRWSVIPVFAPEQIGREDEVLFGLISSNDASNNIHRCQYVEETLPEIRQQPRRRRSMEHAEYSAASARNNHRPAPAGGRKPSDRIYSTSPVNLLLKGSGKSTKRCRQSAGPQRTKHPYNKNATLMRCLLVNYVKLTLCSCYDTLALTTFLLFMLCLSNFIEAHHHHQANNQHQPATRRLGAGLRAVQLYWNKTMASNQYRHQEYNPTPVLEATTGRGRRSLERLAVTHAQPETLLFDEEEYSQQRAAPPYYNLEEAINVKRRAELDSYQSVTTSNLPRRSARENEQQRNAQTKSNSQKMGASSSLRAPIYVASAAKNTERSHQKQQRPPRNQHLVGEYNSSSNRPSFNATDQAGDGQSLATDQTLTDWSFRQASPDFAPPETSTVSPLPPPPPPPPPRTPAAATTAATQSMRTSGGASGASGSRGRPQTVPKSRLAPSESSWIPITRLAAAATHQRANGPVPQVMVPVASSNAASALLDYPTHADLSLHAHSQHHPINNKQRDRPDSLQQLGSHHGERHPHSEFGPASYEMLEHNNYINHMHGHHHHHHWPRRRPRFQGELDNEIGANYPPPPPPPPHHVHHRPGKMYKRVLLCDKTLVSLDYIRHFDMETRPSQPVGQLLDEHEISEISDNFLNLESAIDPALARSSAGSGTETATMIKPDSTSRWISSQTNNSIFGEVPRLADKSVLVIQNASVRQVGEAGSTNETDQRTSMSVAMLDRRFWPSRQPQALLSDEDPLVRCDMWDLEKGLKSRKPPGHILRMAIKADFDTVRDAINRCRQLSERTLPPDDEHRDGLEALMSTEDLISLFSMKRGLMPGTKWCGLGDQADSYNDLGPKHRIDICCRAHDHCPIRSKPFRNDYGILNIGLYTKSHCDCDADFYRCLREVRSRTADMLGNLYFNVMKLQCMREERLKVCREMRPIALGFERCIRYEDSPVKTIFKFTTPPVAY